ncbi:flagellar motor protein MotB [Lentisphaerota bacterium WC36G]|nr:flagellar motor protein MotB [Lentisphaerae bacterium WC36]
MGKKRVLIGGPPYMAQFTALMMILLACFILMVAMSPKKEKGVEQGVGSIRNAFSSVGGFGIFDFITPYFGTKNANNKKSAKGDLTGVDINTTLREGGTGNSSAKSKDLDNGCYLRYQFHCNFKDVDSSLTKEIKEKLAKLGTGLSVFKQKLVIKCISSDYPIKGKNSINNREKNRQLATYRAANIMRFLAKQSGVSYVNMTALGEYNSSKEKTAENTIVYFSVYNIEKTTKDSNNGR